MSNLMTTPQLTQWLRDNSAGIYRPAAEAADLIEEQRRWLVSAQRELDALYAFALNNGIAEAGDPLHRKIKRFLARG